MRSVLITGVSKGLGSAFFEEFVGAGDRVLAIGRRFTENQYARERAEPQRIRLRVTDLAYPASLPTAAELASFVHGASEIILIHNAATVRPIGAIGTLPPDQVAYAASVNFVAPILLTNALLATGVIRPTGEGAGAAAVPLTVLFISSAAAHRPVGGWAVYAATKRGAEAFFDGLSAQHAEDGRVRVININPGVMDTEMQEQLREYAKSGVYFPDGERFVSLHTHRELPHPLEVARKIIADTLH
ncbi:SDR family NAD(P)-dependent oxidoreductase [Luedemannella flava]|uniref:SDR family NAD(P)-dependent oxidoreductase n=1 Tax=Luedemannella flava TaxID=349316 RepID=UPI0031E0362C